MEPALRSGTFTLFSIRGVPLKIHFSLIILLFYVIFIASVQFRQVAAQARIDPELLHLSARTWGFFFALGLFASVAIHEYGHVFVARMQGVKVKGITLMMLGGVSEMEKMPERKYAEFALAIIGPLVSFALAGLLFFVKVHTTSPDLIFYCHWLGSANLMLAIFNVLPAFPLDGGRALRSLLAAHFGKTRATQLSTGVSTAFAFALGLWAMASFNLILVVIAFFIYAVSQRELLLVRVQQSAEGIRVRDAYTAMDPVHEDSFLSVAAERMLREKLSLIPVKTQSGQGALLSLARISREPEENWGKLRVTEIPGPNCTVLGPEDAVSDILPDLLNSPVRALPVHQGNRVLGILRYADLERVIQLKSHFTSGGSKKDAAA
ncbi:MAG: site-2 protease family protein [Methylotenera sp.]|nr:site-2 protease family protein [Oligoflexia bacterium]